MASNSRFWRRTTLAGRQSWCWWSIRRSRCSSRRSSRSSSPALFSTLARSRWLVAWRCFFRTSSIGCHELAKGTPHLSLKSAMCFRRWSSCEQLTLQALRRPWVSSAILETFEADMADLPQVCDDSVDAGVFLDSAVIGVGYLIGFVLMSLSIKPFGRRKILGLMSKTRFEILIFTWIFRF